MCIKMDVEKLIDLIRCQPALYDAENSNYNVPTHRVQVWENIAKEMNSTVTSCKARWCNLRDIYRKSKRVFNKDGSLQNYRFAEQLTFLDQHLRLTRARKPTSGTSTENLRQRNRKKYHAKDANATNKKRKQSQSQSQNDADVVLKVETIEDEENSSLNKEYFVKLTPATSTFDNPITTDTTVDEDTPKSSIYTDCNHFCNCNCKHFHHVDAFLTGIAPMLKEMSPVLLNRARSEIFDVVSKYEMQMLLGQDDASYQDDKN